MPSYNSGTSKVNLKLLRAAAAELRSARDGPSARKALHAAQVIVERSGANFGLAPPGPSMSDQDLVRYCQGSADILLRMALRPVVTKAIVSAGIVAMLLLVVGAIYMMWK